MHIVQLELELYMHNKLIQINILHSPIHCYKFHLHIAVFVFILRHLIISSTDLKFKTEIKHYCVLSKIIRIHLHVVLYNFSFLNSLTKVYRK